MDLRASVLDWYAMSNRIIKFRAWDKKNKKMHQVFCNEIQPWFDEDFSVPKGFGIMQFTGVKDKTGKEIYDGDIILSKDTCAIVSWDYSLGGWQDTPQSRVFDSDFLYNHSRDESDDVLGYVIVIGNIYENPELIIDKSSNDQYSNP